MQSDDMVDSHTRNHRNTGQHHFLNLPGIGSALAMAMGSG